MNYTKFTPSKTDFSVLSFWQNPYWNAILEESWQAKTFYFWNEKSTFFLVEIRSVGLWFSGAFILWVKKSQIFDDFEECCESLKKFLQQEGIIFLQIEPLDEVENFSKFSWNSKFVTRKFLTPFTRVISLEQSEEEILADMSQQSRRSIRGAEKKWVKVEEISGKNVTSELLDRWMQLVEETTKRDKFSHNSREYYQKFLSELGDDVSIFSAYFEGKIIAMILVTFIGDEAIYYYGASSSDILARKISAPYTLLFHSMRVAKVRWKKIYDLLWIADPNNSHDPLVPVSEFKRKLGWSIKKLPNKIICVLSVKFYFYFVLVKIKKLFK